MRFVRFICGAALTSLLAIMLASATSGRGFEQSGAPDNWHGVDARAFWIMAPSGWEFHQLQGIDSYVGEFAGDGVKLKFDFGRYSNPLDEEKEPAYVVTHKSIDGFRAKVVSPRKPGQGLTAVYFRNVGQGNKLCLWGENLTPPQQELALKVFDTIRFASRRGLPLPVSPHHS